MDGAALGGRGVTRTDDPAVLAALDLVEVRAEETGGGQRPNCWEALAFGTRQYPARLYAAAMAEAVDDDRMVDALRRLAAYDLERLVRIRGGVGADELRRAVGFPCLGRDPVRDARRGVVLHSDGRMEDLVEVLERQQAEFAARAAETRRRRAAERRPARRLTGRAAMEDARRAREAAGVTDEELCDQIADRMAAYGGRGPLL